MKISTLLTGFIVACFFARAQTKTIEVTVTDTVYVKATEFLYVIKTNDAYGDMYDAPDTAHIVTPYFERRASAIKQHKRIQDSLSSLLTAKGFMVQPPPVEGKFVQYYEETGFELYIQTHSLDSVQMLYNIIKGNLSFIGYISSRHAGDEAPGRKRLMVKALTAARVKALAIAEAGKLSLGAVTTVKEVEHEGGWVAYPPLSASSVIPGWHARLTGSETLRKKEGTDDYYVISATLSVTFAAN